MNLGADIQKKVIKSIVTYMAYFGSRYVGNDIQLLCGNIFDRAFVKTLTLFCIMFQATDNLELAIIMTLIFLVAQYLMSLSPVCTKYIDPTATNSGTGKASIASTSWPQARQT